MKAILEGHTPTKFRKIHKEVSELRTQGTGEGFRTKEVVQDWYITENSFLWVRGGRTIADPVFIKITKFTGFLYFNVEPQDSERKIPLCQ